ncbi:conjugal transfer protein TrbI [Scytonema sp. PCC 10023]|uniref:conjugal transfer protein TrbI n=1 Tax=Scytonema sp. PCC 10023 TaxID=1680591 RepID=UPI0039C74641
MSHSQNGTTLLPPDDQLDSEWDEAKLAQLIGFDDDLNAEEVTGELISEGVDGTLTEGEKADLSHDSSQNVIAQSELFDDPQTGKTQPTLSGNPFAKLGVVGLGLLVVFGSSAMFLNTIMRSKPKSAPSMVTVSKPEIKETEVETQEVETGKFKAQLALASQAEKIKSVEQSKSPKTTTVKKPTDKPSSSTAPVTRLAVNKSQTVPPVRYVAVNKSQTVPPVRYVYVSRPPQPVRQPLRLPVQQSVQQPVRLAPISSPTVRETPKSNASASDSKPVDPMEQWAAMSRLGSYGGTQTSEVTASASNETLRQPSVSAPARLASADTSHLPSEQSSQQHGSAIQEVRARSASDKVTIKRATPVRAMSDGFVPQEPAALDAVVAAQVNPAQEAALLTGVPVQRLTVGGQAQGKLVTPVIWADSKSSTTVATKSDRESEKFIIQLAESLTDEQGFVTLPVGTAIVAQVVDIPKSGLAQLEATQIVIDGQEYVLPSGAISIRGTKGQPLIANKWGNKGGAIASHDATTFLFGSLAKVGEVINRPDVESSTSTSGSGFSTSTTTRSSSPNLLGAVLEGGFAPLTKQILQRNERDLQKMLQRSDVWYVRAGTNVQVFVNQSFEF